jgi:AraC-like DNA-binding protein
MPAMVRAQSLRGYRELVRDLGGNPNRLLTRSGVKPDALDQLTTFITFSSLIDLLERSAIDLDCPDFGLRLAERQDIGVLGTLAVAMQYSTTLGEALRCASKYLHVYNAAIAFNLEAGGARGESLLTFGILGDHAPSWAQTADHGLGLAWRITTVLSEGRCRLRHVWLPHAAMASEATYHLRFDAPLTFAAERAALAINAKDLDRNLSEHNDDLRDLAVGYLMGQARRRPSTLEEQVRQAIEGHLGTGTCTYRNVARTLYMHPRTMQRRLQEDGTTFEAIKDEVRRDLAQRYLSEPEVPLAQVSFLLDYSEQSALGRSCQRWFNTTPRGLRSRLSSGTPVPSMV